MLKQAFAAAVLIALTINAPASAQKLMWTWSADESQVKNAGTFDGSTESPATGDGSALYDPATNMMTVSYTWSGFESDLIRLHLHGPATPDTSNMQHVIEAFDTPNFPPSLVGDLRTGSYTHTFELTTLSQPGFADLSPADILQIMTDGLAYVNYHTDQFGMGEIRGNLGLPVTVPEPAGLLVCSATLLAAGGLRRTRPARR